MVSAKCRSIPKRVLHWVLSKSATSSGKCIRYILYHPYVSRLELTRDEKSLPSKKRREAWEAKCGRGFTVKIVIMESIISYPCAHYFESACALSFVSGRGLPELAGTAVHEYQSQVKLSGLQGYKGT